MTEKLTKQEKIEVTKDLRELGVSDEEILKLYERSMEWNYEEEEVIYMGTSFTMLCIYYKENDLIPIYKGGI